MSEDKDSLRPLIAVLNYLMAGNTIDFCGVEFALGHNEDGQISSAWVMRKEDGSPKHIGSDMSIAALASWANAQPEDVLATMAADIALNKLDR